MITFPNAKINLGLYITGKRNDGFHNLETVFFPVGWSDVLEIANSKKLEFSASGILIPGDPENNLVMRSYSLLKKDYDLPAIKIHLHKQIPFGAGLGGGSADGAFMLKMLNKFFDLKISEAKLMDYAARLGSDCPFFIQNKPAFATGKGELMNIINLSLNNSFLFLVKPPVEVSTAKAFQSIKPEKSGISLPYLLNLPIERWRTNVLNQFESSVFQQYPEIAAIKQKLYDQGAVYASMSGSGSCVYSIFKANPGSLEKLFPLPYLTFGQHL